MGAIGRRVPLPSTEGTVGSPEGSAAATLVGRTIESYRIDKLLGVGGMGEVYRGWDQRLNRPVAVKVLRSTLGGNETARQRFVRETRLACQVSHPYVALVLDVVERAPDLYLVMEYIEGRRLDEVIAADRPDWQQVTRYGLEVAEALAAIHGTGMVHRDLKPANVMIAPTGHVKVLDFGVARQRIDADALTTQGDTAVDSTLTAAGAAVGTLRYMSPEQLRGRAVDPRSDLFSLGVILYEAALGRHPFARATPQETAEAILNESPGSGVDATALAKSPLSRVILRLLEKDASRRYDRVEEVVAELRSILAGEASGPSAAPEARPRSRRVALVAAALALLAALAIWTAWRPWSRPGSAGSGRPTVAVLPFEDRIGDAEGGARGAMLADLLAAELSESKLLRGLDGERVRQALGGSSADDPRPARLARVSRACSPRWILAGSVWREGPSYQARVDLYDGDRPDQPRESFKTEALAAATMVELSATRLLGLLFPPAATADGAGRSGSSPASRSDEANLVEFEARQAVRELRYGEAIKLLERARELDPQFSVADVRLAEALHLAGYGARAREAAARVGRRLSQPGVAAPQHLRLEAAAVEAMISADLDSEIEARSNLAELHPDEPGRLLALAAALERGRRGEEALPVVDRGLALDPADPRIHLQRAGILMVLGRSADAAAALDRAQRLFDDLESQAGRGQVLHLRGDLAFRAPDYEAARAGYEAATGQFQAAGLDTLAARSERAAGDCEVLLGRLAPARIRHERVLAIFRESGNYEEIVNTLNTLGSQAYVRGQFAEAEQTLRLALEEGRALDNPRLSLYPTLNLGGLLAYTQRLEGGRVLLEQGLGLSRSVKDARAEATALSQLAGIEANRGRLAEAAGAYRDLLALQRSDTGAGDEIGSTLAGLAEVHEMAGQIGEALSFAEQAVEQERRLGRRSQLAYRLWMRAVVRRHLADWSGVDSDIDEARGIAETAGSRIEDLLPRLDLVRAQALMMRGRWQEAGSWIARALEASQGSSAVGLEAPALTLSCEQRQRVGEFARALELGRSAVEHPRAQVSERAEARVALARALAAANDPSAAADEARLALEEAQACGLALVAARAAAVLSGLPLAAEAADGSRALGTAMLGRYLDSVPAQQRDRVRARPDLLEILAELREESPQ